MGRQRSYEAHIKFIGDKIKNQEKKEFISIPCEGLARAYANARRSNVEVKEDTKDFLILLENKQEDKDSKQEESKQKKEERKKQKKLRLQVLKQQRIQNVIEWRNKWLRIIVRIKITWKHYIKKIKKNLKESKAIRRVEILNLWKKTVYKAQCKNWALQAKKQVKKLKDEKRKKEKEEQKAKLWSPNNPIKYNKTETKRATNAHDKNIDTFIQFVNTIKTKQEISALFHIEKWVLKYAFNVIKTCLMRFGDPVDSRDQEVLKLYLDVLESPWLPVNYNENQELNTFIEYKSVLKVAEIEPILSKIRRDIFISRIMLCEDMVPTTEKQIKDMVLVRYKHLLTFHSFLFIFDIQTIALKHMKYLLQSKIEILPVNFINDSTLDTVLLDQWMGMMKRNNHILPWGAFTCPLDQVEAIISQWWEWDLGGRIDLFKILQRCGLTRAVKSATDDYSPIHLQYQRKSHQRIIRKKSRPAGKKNPVIFNEHVEV